MPVLDVPPDAVDNRSLYVCELVEEGLCVANADIGEELEIAEPRTVVVRAVFEESVI